MNELFGLHGQTAIVSGAATGPGFATAKLFAAAGAFVVMTDISPDVGSGAREIGQKAIGVAHDVRSRDSWAEVARTALDATGRIDVLINNAGIFRRSSLDESSPELINDLYETNQLGPLFGIQAVSSYMRERGGAIINVSSTACMHGSPKTVPYAMTKWALRGLTQGAAVELAPYGIRVNCIIPGRIASSMSDVTGPIASASLYLCSSAAAYITGAELVVDGALSV